MSATLNLLDRLLDHGRNLQQLGRERDARRVLLRIARFEELPDATAEETQVQLAELALNRRRYRRARRHLTAALRYQPNSARTHYLLAVAVDAEDTGNPRRAARHYRRSLELDPNQPRCLLDLGLLHLREGRPTAGRNCLRRAVELAPDDPETVREAASGLVLAGETDEARTLLRGATFRHPRDGRFRQAWNEFQFRQLANEQEMKRKTRPGETTAGPVLLPFARRETAAADERTIRHDGPAPVAPPHDPQPIRGRFDRRRAQ